MSFGKRIKALRRNKDMTQEQLAEILSVSPQAVSRWETDAAMPDISLIPAICNLFDTSADHLLGIDSENKKKRISEIDDRFNSLADRGYYREAREVLEMEFTLEEVIGIITVIFIILTYINSIYKKK